MTVASTNSKAGPYAGAGTTGPFAVDFRFLEDSHLQVIRTSAAGVATTLTLTTDYTVTGAGGTSGEVTLVAALAVGETLTVLRSVPATQETDYVQNDAFPAESHERALDKLTMIAQQQSEILSRAITVPTGESSVPSLPAAADRANTLLGFDANGAPIVTTPGAGSAEGVALDLAEFIADLANAADPTKGAALLGFLQSGVGAVGRTLLAKGRDSLNARDFGVVADGTTDDRVNLQKAIDAAGAARKKLILPEGDIRCSGGLNATSSTAGMEHERLTIQGQGKNATRILFDAGTNAMFECQGSDAVTLCDFSMYGAANVGIFAARGADRQWCGNMYLHNLIVYVNSDIAKNGGVGSVGVLNIESEEFKYHNLEIWADTPFAMHTPGNGIVATFDASCNPVADRTITFTPSFLPVLGSAISNTVGTFSGGCRLVAHTFDSPNVQLRGVSAVDFGNTFFQKRGAGFQCPFVFDLHTVFRMWADGTHEPAVSSAQGMGCAVIRGSFEGSRINCTTGNKTTSTNDVPLLYFTANNGVCKETEFNIRVNGQQDQLPVKISSLTNFNYSLHGVEFRFQGTAGLGSIPTAFLFNATKTRLRFGQKTGGGSDYGEVYCDTRYRHVYSVFKELTTGAATPVFNLLLPPADIIAATAKFRGTVLAGWIIGQTQAYTKPGEFDVQLVRNAAGTTLTHNVAYARWAAGLSTDAAQLTMTDPSVTLTPTGTTSVMVSLQSNTAGPAAAATQSILVGELEVVSGYGNSARVVLAVPQ